MLQNWPSPDASLHSTATILRPHMAMGTANHHIKYLKCSGLVEVCMYCTDKPFQYPCNRSLAPSSSMLLAEKLGGACQMG